MQALQIIAALISLLDTAVQAEGAFAGVLQPIIDKMTAENRTTMTPEEKAHLRGITDAARAYALASKPGDPLA
jgi:hypothetical protein